jgi:ribose transport system permease protein
MATIKTKEASINNRLSSFGKKLIGLNELGVLIALVLLCIVINSINPLFFTVNNILNVLRQISTTAIIAVGMSYVIITGGIDLSVGSSMCIGAMLCASLSNIGMNPWLALIVSLIAAGALGAVSAFTIVVLRITPFIATMAMMYVIRGLAYLMSEGMPIPFNTTLNFLGGKLYNKIPIPAIIMVVILIIGHIILTKTVYGRNLFAVGGNERAARLSGIQVEKIKFSVYIIIAILSALAGIISAANTSSAASNMGTGKEMDAIAAAVIGGCSLAGGKGSIFGVIIGAAILGVIRNGFVLLVIPSSWQSITIGGVLVIACALDLIQSKKNQK